MIIEAIGIAAIFIGIIGLLTQPAFLVYVFFLSLLLGSAAAIQLPSLGNSTILPPHLILGFLAVQCFAQKSNLLSLGKVFSFPRAGFWLLLAVLYGLMSAVFFPRLFSGYTYVFTIRGTQIGTGIFLTPLEPASGNVTQSIYFLGDLVCFGIFFIYASNAVLARKIMYAAICCGIGNLLFALLDLVTFWTGTAQILEFIRNANYSMLDTAEVQGFKRIVGSFPEASTFGGITLGLFTFHAKLLIDGIHPRVTVAVSFLSLLALVFSTSSTAYGGTSITLGVLYLVSMWRVVRGPVSKETMAFVLVFPLTLALNTAAWDTVNQMIDSTIINKLSSGSGVERTAWTWQALVNFSDTMWLGAGVGSVRGSSFPAVVLGSMGLFGAITYLAFFACLFFVRSGRWTGPLAIQQSAARWACFSQLAAAVVGGGSVDLGLLFFSFAGLACGRSADRPASASPNEKEPGNMNGR
jgi:hypothetical protein